jgi:hypothetical protein
MHTPLHWKIAASGSAALYQYFDDNQIRYTLLKIAWKIIQDR